MYPQAIQTPLISVILIPRPLSGAEDTSPKLGEGSIVFLLEREGGKVYERKLKHEFVSTVTLMRVYLKSKADCFKYPFDLLG